MRGLNAEQQHAVSTRKGRVRAIAVPGSGKTTVTVWRILSLLEAKVKPKKLLSLTFTKEAALEMARRAAFYLLGAFTPEAQRGIGKAKIDATLAKHGIDTSEHKIFRNFHSFALDFVVKERAAFPYPLENFPLLIPGQRNKIIGNIIKQYPAMDFESLSSYLSLQKRSNISPEEAQNDVTGEGGAQFAEAYAKFERACRTAGPNKLGLLDFDSCMLETVRLLETNQDVLKRWQFEHVQTDEAQDNDRVQWRLLELIGGKSKSLFCVGDPDQNMYEWRGAEADGLTTKFEERFPGEVTTIDLPTNYRSTPEIIAYLNEICPTEGKVLRAVRASGSPVKFQRYPQDIDEALDILQQITNFENTAVLTRTNRGLRPFEDLCMIRGTKYRLLGKSGFWGQDEIMTAMSFIQYLLAPTDNSVMRIIRSPFDCSRNLRKTEVIERLKEMQRQGIGKRKFHTLLGDFKCGDREQDLQIYRLAGFLDDLKKEVVQLPAPVAVETIINRVDMLGYYENAENHENDNDPVDNLAELIKIAKRRPTLHEFLLYAHKCATASRNETGITLSTIHQAKGKEWENVFVAGVNEGTVPHKKGTAREEKRIYYVGCSRAGSQLSVSTNGVPSAFIKHKLPKDELSDIDPAFLEDFVGLLEGLNNEQQPT